MYKPYLIGIAGGSGSGKTYFLKRLQGLLPPSSLSVISQDNYYKPIHQQPRDEQDIPNYDTLQSIHMDELVGDVQLLLKGQPIARMEYVYNNPAIVPSIIGVNSAPIIVVEGIFTLSYPPLSQLLHLKIFMEVWEDIKLQRRIERDKEERGYNAADVVYRYQRHASPAFENHIQPFKSTADLIIPNHHGCDKALEVIVGFLRSL